MVLRFAGICCTRSAMNCRCWSTWPTFQNWSNMAFLFSQLKVSWHFRLQFPVQPAPICLSETTLPDTVMYSLPRFFSRFLTFLFHLYSLRNLLRLLFLLVTGWSSTGWMSADWSSTGWPSTAWLSVLSRQKSWLGASKALSIAASTSWSIVCSWLAERMFKLLVQSVNQSDAVVQYTDYIAHHELILVLCNLCRIKIFNARYLTTPLGSFSNTLVGIVRFKLESCWLFVWSWSEYCWTDWKLLI